MPIFIVEREFPGVEHLSDVDLRGIAGKAHDAMRELLPPMRWIECFVAGDRFYCVCEAADANQMREHAKRAGLPANRISKVRAWLKPELPAC